jgi:hypothetical protein
MPRRGSLVCMTFRLPEFSLPSQWPEGPRGPRARGRRPSACRFLGVVARIDQRHISRIAGGISDFKEGREEIISGEFSWHRWCTAVVGGVAACGLLTISIPAALADNENASDAQWTMGGQNLNNSRHQDVTLISPQNVAKLKTKWVFTTGADVSATPAVSNGVVYFPDWAGNFYALNAETGAVVWQHKVADWTGSPRRSGDLSRHGDTRRSGRRPRCMESQHAHACQRPRRTRHARLRGISSPSLPR